MLNVMLFKMRAERTSCARHITLDWIGLDSGGLVGGGMIGCRVHNIGSYAPDDRVPNRYVNKTHVGVTV